MPSITRIDMKNLLEELGLTEDKAREVLREESLGFKLINELLRVNVDDYITIREAEADAEGYWVGAPTALVFDDRIYLCYRWRRPGDGGYRAVVAESYDGVTLTDIKTMEKTEFGDFISLEKASLVYHPRKRQFYYWIALAEKGYKWGIYALDPVSDPADLNPTSRKLVIPEAKDPRVYYVTEGNKFVMYFSKYMHLEKPVTIGGDTTTEVEAAGYGESIDGVEWETETVFDPRDFGLFNIRFSSVVRLPRVTFAFHDIAGARGHGDQTGVSILEPVKQFLGLLWGHEGAHYVARCLRYADVVFFKGRLLVYAEKDNIDGSHDLVVVSAKLDKDSDYLRVNGTPLTGVSYTANTPTDAVITQGYDLKTFYFKSDATGTLKVQVFDGKTWEDLDSVAVDADKLTIYHTSVRAKAFRLVFDQDANIKAWYAVD